MLQKSNTLGGYGMTPRTITQTSVKVAMSSRFLGLVVSLPPDEQNLCLPNQVVHDPDTWTTPHLLQVKREYDILVDKYVVLQKTQVDDKLLPLPRTFQGSTKLLR